MSEHFKPENTAQLCEAVKWAAGAGQALEIAGTGSKRAIGNVMETDHLLDMTGLSGVEVFQPEELVISARPGTLRADIEKLMDDAGQQFAFEPPDFSHLLGADHAGTLGGMVASNLSGPRRIKAGAVRDHVLGVHAVSGRGEIFKTGGRVVKNVTGYDLSKLLTGSWGTLAAMTNITLKVLPAAQTEATLAIAGLDNEQAVAAMGLAMRSSCEVSGAAHIPGDQTLLRLEGFEASVRARTGHLQDLLKDYGEHRMLDAGQSRKIWRQVRDAKFLSATPAQAVWRISVPPAQGAKVLAAIEDRIPARAFFDWAGGLIWLEVTDGHHAHGADVRTAIARTGGHATLVRAGDEARKGTAAFQPQPEALAALAKRIKSAFDPLNILNRGRM